MEENNYIQKLYSEIAERYGYVNHLLSVGFFVIWRRIISSWICDIVERGNIKSIAELGIGWGEQVQSLFSRCGDRLKEMRFYGVDFSLDMMRIASLRVDWIDRLCGDMLQLPFADEVLDMVYCIFSVRNLPPGSLNGFFKNLHGILKPGGIFLMVEALPPKNPIHYIYIRYVIPPLGAVLTGSSRSYKYLYRSIAEFPSSDEVVEKLERAGFTEIEVKFLPPLSSLAIFTGRKAKKP